ncbi:hypothetical protein THAOC_37854 [Thalassiosira oceanica]|uniref:Uncharacterized protein n=1 Tax=Thalassiosira oceanica TaxID=159749 RepID=K0QYE2_THAOC|nr:hypothetical protein THAOC_37854 [Thalassiosira oceanica]|eukprot:EJK43680.1 hypothetical protein THAOC_37854 [Thalassiosira oceanica]
MADSRTRGKFVKGDEDKERNSGSRIQMAGDDCKWYKRTFPSGELWSSLPPGKKEHFRQLYKKEMNKMKGRFQSFLGKKKAPSQKEEACQAFFIRRRKRPPESLQSDLVKILDGDSDDDFASSKRRKTTSAVPINLLDSNSTRESASSLFDDAKLPAIKTEAEESAKEDSSDEDSENQVIEVVTIDDSDKEDWSDSNKVIDVTEASGSDDVKLWTCDNCKTAQFQSFDEAVEHEKTCDGSKKSTIVDKKKPANEDLDSNTSNKADLLSSPSLSASKPAAELSQPSSFSRRVSIDPNDNSSASSEVLLGEGPPDLNVTGAEISSSSSDDEKQPSIETAPVEISSHEKPSAIDKVSEAKQSTKESEGNLLALKLEKTTIVDEKKPDTSLIHDVKEALSSLPGVNELEVKPSSFSSSVVISVTVDDNHTCTPSLLRHAPIKVLLKRAGLLKGRTYIISVLKSREIEPLRKCVEEINNAQ